MKKFLIIIGIVLGLVILSAFLVPVIFKDDIKMAIDKALSESVNADFVFDTEDFEVTIFDHFPNPSATMKNFGIINREPFEGEILFAVEELEAIISLSSLFGDQIKIKGINMERPKAFLKMLEDGTANWDIAIDEEGIQSSGDTAGVSYNIGIDRWQITDGEVIYEDLTIPFQFTATGLNHEGSGDFTQDVIDMQTYSLADSITVSFDGTEYISDKTAEIDMALRISDNFEKYQFQENRVRVNDFIFSFDGGYTMLPEGFDFDMTFKSQDNSFKSLLSLIPGMYHDEFDKLKASGDLLFDGMVRGKYDTIAKTYPAFDINLQATDAAFKYPDVEKAFSDIQLDLNIRNTTNDIDSTRIALNNFHLLMDKEPFDGKLIIENLVNYPIDAALVGKINLDDINKMVPMEGLTLKGFLDMDLKANGIYDSIKQIMPKLDGRLVLNNGYIKSADFPATLDNFNVNAILTNNTGNFSDFLMNLSRFSFTMDGEPFEGRMTVANLNNYNWDLLAKGTVDLEKLSKILSLEDMELTGQLAANVNTKGNMAAVEAEKYEQLPTSGTVKITNFRYADASLPYDVTISEANSTFNPQRMEISQMKGTIGKSDFDVDGYVNNYIGYALSDNETLKGFFNLRSDNLDLNEFTTEDETTPEVGDETPDGVIEIPKNVDMTLKSNIKSAKFMDMEMTNVAGNIIAKDGIAKMENVNFNLLDGEFIVNGSYNTADVSQPKYDFGLNIKEVSIGEAFRKFEIVRKYIPVAENMTGKFSSDFNLNGLLDQKMSPVLSSIDGGGLVRIFQASLQNSKILQGLTSVTKLANTNEINFKNLKFKASIEDGTFSVEPFDFEVMGYKAVVEGATGIDGSINFLVNLNVPAGKAAQALNQFTGNVSPDQTIVLPVRISGTYSNPQFGLQTGQMKEEMQQAAKEKAKEEVREGVRDALDTLQEGKLKDAIGDILGSKKDTTLKADTTKQPTLQETVEEEAKDKIKDLFKKKKNN